MDIETLLNHASYQVQNLIPEDSLTDADKSMYSLFWSVLWEILDDGQPVPQITLNPEHLLEANWLVNGWFAGLMVDVGSYDLWAEQPDGEIVFQHSFVEGWVPDDERLEFTERMRLYLVDLGKGIKVNNEP